MKRKTSELAGAALDWVVAKCEGRPMEIWQGSLGDFFVRGIGGGGFFQPSTSWAHGGPIIEREGLLIRPQPGRDLWDSWAHGTATPCYSTGSTPLVAAMRCYVASKLGEEVDIPDELA